MLLSFIWMLLGRTGASAVSGENSLYFSIPSPLSIKFEGYYGKFLGSFLPFICWYFIHELEN